MEKIISQKDLAQMEKRYRARLINSLSGAKSANLVGTINHKGQENLSIISSAFHLGAEPALMGFISRPDTVERHTLENIRETQCFTLNHVNTPIIEKAHQTSARFLREESEFLHCQLSAQYKDDFKAPFVKESHIQLGLRLKREVPIEENGTLLLIGEIEKIYLDESLLAKDGYINIQKADSVAVSGLDSYHSLSEGKRLSYAKKDKWPTPLK